MAMRLTVGAGTSGRDEDSAGEAVRGHGDRDGEACEQGGSYNSQNGDRPHETTTIVLDLRHRWQNEPNGTDVDAWARVRYRWVLGCRSR